MKASPGVRRPRAPKNLHRSLRFFALFLLTLLVPAAIWAHTDPPGSTQTGVSLNLTAFRSDGVTPVLPGTVNGCGETIIYRGSISWAGAPNAAIQGGTLTITTPDSVVHPATPLGGIPCLGGTDGVICTPGVLSVNSMDVPFTITNSPSCTPGTTLLATLSYTGGTSHLGANDTPGLNGGTGIGLGLTCCPTPTPTPTTTATATPTNTPTGIPPTNTATPTNTPPETAPPPTVPTLSFPMMALLGLLLAGAGLFLARRR
ncbi:MAG TPA: hypothetical protein VGK86_01240 [Thermoanaerobaculia bacterium]